MGTTGTVTRKHPIPSFFRWCDEKCSRLYQVYDNTPTAAKNILSTVTALIICGVLLGYLTDFSLTHWDYPFAYSGDGITLLETMKNVVNGDGLYNSSLAGGIIGSPRYDFPIPELLHVFGIWACSKLTGDVILGTNIYFGLTFFLTVITTMVLLLDRKVYRPLAITASILYAYAPYKLYRWTAHYFLSCYYLLPLALLVMLWLGEGKLSLSGLGRHVNAIIRRQTWGRLVFAAVVCLLMGIGGLYYAFFACAMLCLVALINCIEKKRLSELILPLLCIGLTAATLIAAMLPSLLYIRANGANPQVAVRNPIEAQVYGLNLPVLIFPNLGHRIASFSQFTSTFRDSQTIVGTSEGSSIGFFADIGFLFLLLTAFVKIKAVYTKTMQLLSKLNLFSVLLAVIGGLGSLVAIFITPQIRCYNRISIFIGLFGLVAFIFLLNGFVQWCRKKTGRLASMAICCCLAGSVLIVGYLDQTPIEKNNDAIVAQVDIDRAFVQQVEELSHHEGVVFQLPYVPYPEYPPVNQMTDYEHIKMPLLSKDTIWSYAAIKGREAASTIEATAALGIQSMVPSLVKQGYNGVYIDRYGYQEEEWIRLEKSLSDLLHSKPLVSDDNRRSFFTLEGYRP